MSKQYSEQFVKESKERFYQANTFNDFLSLWEEFYENKICIPGYFSLFVQDNPDTTSEIGRKFGKITRRGFIPFDSQFNKPNLQKAYVAMFGHKDIVHGLCEHINKYPGFVAFSQKLEDCNTNNLYVTYNGNNNMPLNLTELEKLKYTIYDSSNIIIDEKSKKKGMLAGSPYTGLGDSGLYNFFDIYHWLNPYLQEIFNPDDFLSITIVDTISTEKKDRILDFIIDFHHYSL